MDRIEDFEVNSPRWLSLEDFEGEVWKDIPEYEGWYQVSNMGRIKSLDRFYTQKRKCDKEPRQSFIKGKIIKASSYGQYLICHLKRNGTSKAVKFHRVVCTMFHPNQNKLPEVNHINEIKTDNRADNLEWCTRQYNANWGTAIMRQSINSRNHPAKSKPVYQCTFNGKILKKYPSIKEAARLTGLKEANIASVCYGGKSKSAGGYLWSFSSNVEELQKILKRKHEVKPRHGKNVHQYTLEGKHIATYISAAEASRQTGVCKVNIIQVCNHVVGYKSAGGFLWKYE